jgi:hypothetical protein
MKNTGAFLLAATLLAGCADMTALLGGTTPGRAHPRAENLPAPKEQSALREGIRLYNDGDFNGAIRRLSSSEVTGGSMRTRLTALKYTAFSYCVTSRQAQCRQAFEKALKLDPSFQLAPGERGHPLWGPVFEKARSERQS